MSLTTLNPATIAALQKALTAAKSATRADLPVGDNEVDEVLVLHIAATTRCGEDYEQSIVAKADPWTLLAAALSHLNGVTVDSLVRECLTADPALIASIKKEAKTAIAAVKGPTKTACKGKVTFKDLSVSVVTPEGVSVSEEAAEFFKQVNASVGVKHA